MALFTPPFAHSIRLSSFLQNGRRAAITFLGMRSRFLSSVVEVPEFECDGHHDDAKATDKDAALRMALSRLSGDFGRESRFSLQRFFGSRHAPVISTGSLKLDMALGIGGLPKVAALVPQREVDVPIGATYEDVQSQIMSQALRKIHYSLCQSETLIIFVNQVRLKVKSGQGFGHADEVTCGGNALRFYAAVRMRIIRIGLLKTGDKITGLGVCIEVVKNKLAPAMKKAALGIQFGRGICCESDVLDLACEHGVILKEGSSYFIEGEVFNTKHEAEWYLVEDEGILDKIVTTLRRQLFEREK